MAAKRTSLLLVSFLVVRPDSVQVPNLGLSPRCLPCRRCRPGQAYLPRSGMPRTGNGSRDPGARFASSSDAGLGSGGATTRLVVLVLCKAMLWRAELCSALVS